MEQRKEKNIFIIGQLSTNSITINKEIINSYYFPKIKKKTKKNYSNCPIFFFFLT